MPAPETKRPLKILYHHRTASRDGQAVHIEEMIRALREIGCELIVVEPPATAAAGFGAQARGLAAIRRLMPKAIGELLELGYSWVAYRRLKRAYLKHRPDVLYERHNLYLLAGKWLKRRFGIPYLLEVNMPIAMERAQHGGLALPWLARRLEVSVWKAADVVLPVTGVLAGILADHGVPPERIRVVHNGINPGAFEGLPERDEAKRRLGLDGRLVLGFTGFVRAWHGLDQVIDFMADAGRENLVLLVVGDGPARAALEERARRLGIASQVRFMGVVERERIPSVLAAFDIALQPAATPYASPLKLFEYMAAACPIVAPRQANITEILGHEANGLLFPPGERDALSAALSRLVAERELRERLGHAARATIKERGYTWLANAGRVVAEARQLTMGPAEADAVRSILVLGSSVTALGVLREARQLGLSPLVFDTRSGAAMHSRYADRLLVSAQDEQALIRRLVELGAKDRAIIATEDRWLRFLMAHRAAIDGAYGAVLAPRNEVLATCLDKTAFAQWCAKQSLPAPRTWGLDNLAEVALPALIRPASTLHHQGASSPPKAVFVESRESLNYWVGRFRASGAQALVSESLLGAGIAQYSVPFAAREGSIVSFVARKVRPPASWARTGTYVELCPNPAVEALARRAIAALECRGIGEVEILHSEADGRSWLIEINQRPWVQYALATRSRHDFLAFMLKADRRAREPVKNGVRWLSLRGDLYVCLSRGEGLVRRGELGLSAWICSLLTANCHAHFAWRDPGPAINEVMAFAREAFGALARRRIPPAVKAQEPQ